MDRLKEEEVKGTDDSEVAQGKYQYHKRNIRGSNGWKGSDVFETNRKTRELRKEGKKVFVRDFLT